MATNIHFGSYTPKPKKTFGKEFIFGIFFDGTLNNKTNTEGRLAYNKRERISDSDMEKALAYGKYGIDDEKSSYQNEYSNVASKNENGGTETTFVKLYLYIPKEKRILR